MTPQGDKATTEAAPVDGVNKCEIYTTVFFLKYLYILDDGGGGGGGQRHNPCILVRFAA